MLEDIVSNNISLRTLNQKRVLNILYNEGYLTQADIKEKSGLSGPTVSQCIQSFKESGVFVEGKELASSGGRKPRTIAFNYDYRYAVGLEIRRHHIDISILNLKGNVVKANSFRILFELSSKYLKKVNEEVNCFIDSNIDRKKVLGICLAFPGEVSLDRQKITRSTLLNIHKVISIETIQKYFDLPISMEYGPNAAAFGSAFKSNNQKDLCYIVVTDNGVAGSIILNNKIYRGQSGRAGAFGHILLNADKNIANNSWSSLCAVTTLTGEEEGDFASFFEDIDKNINKQKRLDKYLHHMAQGIASVRLAYDNDVVIGGKIVPYLQPYLNQLKQYILQFPSMKDDENFNISFDSFSSSPMAEGAALLLVSRFFERED